MTYKHDIELIETIHEIAKQIIKQAPNHHPEIVTKAKDIVFRKQSFISAIERIRDIRKDGINKESLQQIMDYIYKELP